MKPIPNIDLLPLCGQHEIASLLIRISEQLEGITKILGKGKAPEACAEPYKARTCFSCEYMTLHRHTGDEWLGTCNKRSMTRSNHDHAPCQYWTDQP